MVAVVELRERKAPLIVGGVWMLGMCVLLYFIPVINGLVGGLIGGYKVGTWRRALVTVVLAVVASSFVLTLVYGVMDLSLLIPVGNMSPRTLIIGTAAALIVGAVVGSLVGNAHKSPHPTKPAPKPLERDIVRSDAEPPLMQ